MSFRSKLLVMSLIPLALAAVLLVGCGGPSVEEYKQEALEIHTMTGEEISQVLMDLSEVNIVSDEDALAIFKSSFEEALEVVEANYAFLQGLDVPSQAEEVHAELLDLYQETADVFKGLLASLETLDINEPDSLEQFAEDIYNLQDIGEKGAEMVDKIEAL